MGKIDVWGKALVASGVLIAPSVAMATPPTPAQTYADSTAHLIIPAPETIFSFGDLNKFVDFRGKERCETFFRGQIRQKEIEIVNAGEVFFVAEFIFDELTSDTRISPDFFGVEVEAQALIEATQALKEKEKELSTLQERLIACLDNVVGRQDTTFSSKGLGSIRSQFGSDAGSKTKFHFGGTISGFDDNRTFADRDANTQTGFVGVSKQINPQTSVGVQLGFSQSEVSSVALDSTLDSEFFGLTAFAAHQLSQNVALSGFIGYAHGTNDLDLNGALGNFDTDVFSIGAQIQGRYDMDGFTISPDASVAFSQINNDSFLASNGVATNAKSLTLGVFSAGASVSKSFVANDGSLITASLGLHGVYNTQSDNSLDLINGATIGETGFGVKLTPSLNIAMANGGTFSISGNYGQYSDVSDWSLGASLNIPLR